MSMTREEAIEALQKFVNGYEKNICGEAVRQNGFVQAIKVVISALRPITREQVEKMRGEWIADGEKVPVDENGCPKDWAKCSVCGEYLTASEEYDCTGHFCPACGSPMTDKAVDMVMERLEALHSETKTD